MIFSIRNAIPRNMLKLLLNALVFSHLHYSLVVLHSTEKKFLTSIEKQINCALKATFNRKKSDSTKELRKEHSVIPISLFLETKKILYFWRIKRGLLPSFDNTLGKPLPTWTIEESNTATRLFCKDIFKSNKWRYGFVGSAIKSLNNLPHSIKRNANKRNFKSYLVNFQLESLSKSRILVIRY